jgi:hypothetical protein
MDEHLPARRDRAARLVLFKGEDAGLGDAKAR